MPSLKEGDKIKDFSIMSTNKLMFCNGQVTVVGHVAEVLANTKEMEQ